MIDRRRFIQKENFYPLVFFFCLALVLVLFFMVSVAFSAPRSSGSRTQCIGSPCETLYLPVTQEEKGAVTGSTDSYNNNAVVVASAIARVELQASNTNYVEISGSTQTKKGGLNVQGTLGFNVLKGGATSYIQNSNSLQSGSTFYVSSASVDGQTILARTSGNVGIGTATPQSKLSFGGTEPFIGMATTDGADTSVLKIGGGGAGADYTRGGRAEP